MTRKEALSREKSDWKNTVDKIYDDFENQVCEDCEHFTKTTCPIIEMEAYDEVKNPFGCNRFKEKVK